MATPKTQRKTPAAGDGITVTATPDRVSAGGVVLVTAEVDGGLGDGPFEVEWTVEGPDLVGRRDRVALLGATTVSGNQVTLDRANGQNSIRATLDTAAMAVGPWQVTVELTPADGSWDGDGDGDGEGPPVYTGTSDPVVVLPRPLGPGDDLAVTLKRTAVSPTSDQSLWVAIRQNAGALGFDSYDRFMHRVLCGEWPDRNDRRNGSRRGKDLLTKVGRRTALPFPNVDEYRLLKAATEVFLMVNCGVAEGDLDDLDLDAESRRVGRTLEPGEVEEQFRRYLTRTPVGNGTGDSVDVLPYLGLVRLKLRDVPIVGYDREEDEKAEICHGILAERLTNPCFLELIWSYWNDEGMLVRTMGAITQRFQNRTRHAPGRDPLAGLEIDPLRPLNNLLWGWIQDAPHRLSTVRRAHEYLHAYGLVLSTKAGPPVRAADSRSRFVEAFHHLLSLCTEFYREDDDTTVIADGFGVLNALKEVHLLLSQGAHNQYLGLPWTARHEMLMLQWILARPEMAEFLPTRTMTAYQEPWMDRVDSMCRLQGWSDVSVAHFRDLAVFGEQLLLGARFGAWSTVIEPEQAANWARYWRPEVKGYVHAYGAVTGVDLGHRGDGAMPGFHMRRSGYRG